MSVSLNIRAFAGKNSDEFQKHLRAVKFCLENELSFPSETSEFFEGRVGGDDLEDINREAILQHIQNGVEVELPLTESNDGLHIQVSSIPKEVDEIIVSLS